jgi:hypothetical protein
MDVRKPKPIHGWKEFLGEIGVIVVGISIALIGEQVVEALHWREQVKSAHDALANDMTRVVGFAAEREAFSGCIDQHLNRWSDMIEDGARTGRLPAQGAVHRAPRRLWHLNSWDGLVSAGIGPHLPRKELLAVSLLAYDLNAMSAAETDEDVQWTRLYTMVGPGRPVEAGEMVELRGALSRARADAKSLRLASQDITYVIEFTKLLPKEVEKRAQDERVTFAKTHCVPHDPVPAHYGDGPPAGLPLNRPLGR